MYLFFSFKIKVQKRPGCLKSLQPKIILENVFPWILDSPGYKVGKNWPGLSKTAKTKNPWSF